MMVTFDFDNTLTETEAEYTDGKLSGTRFLGPNQSVVDTLKAAHGRGDEIRVITSRHSRDRGHVSDVLESFGVLGLLSNVHYTAGVPKGDWMTQRSIVPDRHFDDDPAAIGSLPEGVEGITVPVHQSWELHNKTSDRSAPSRMAAMMGAS